MDTDKAPSTRPPWIRADLWLVDELVRELALDGRPLPRAAAAIDLRAWWWAHSELPSPTEAARRWRWEGEYGRKKAARFLRAVEEWSDPRLVAEVRAYLRL